MKFSYTSLEVENFCSADQFTLGSKVEDVAVVCAFSLLLVLSFFPVSCWKDQSAPLFPPPCP